MTETGTCSLCGQQYTHWGNNPAPLKEFEERCCDKCNHEKVIPARMGRPPGGLGTWEEHQAAMELLKQRHIADGQGRL